MPRVKRGPKRSRRRTKILKQAKGYYGAKSRLYKSAKEAVEKALGYAYVGRKLKKRDFRAWWIIRINAAVRPHGLSYSKFMHGLKRAGVDLNRKSLAQLAVTEPGVFAQLVETAKQSLAQAS